MRNEAARLRRQRREMRAAVAEMTEAAMALADNVIAQAPNRHIPEEELARVEVGVIDIVLNQARAALQAEGGSAFRFSYLEGRGLEDLREAFGRRFRDQARLMLSQPEGSA